VRINSAGAIPPTAAACAAWPMAPATAPGPNALAPKTPPPAPPTTFKPIPH
jgi:hypothetical protein